MDTVAVELAHHGDHQLELGLVSQDAAEVRAVGDGEPVRPGDALGLFRLDESGQIKKGRTVIFSLHHQPPPPRR